MKVLYFKGSTKRRREFQIKTKIIEQDGKVVVVKEPIYEEGTAHVYKTYENIELAKKIYQNKAVEGKYTDGCLTIPFYFGETLGHRLRKVLTYKKNAEGVKELLRIWEKLIIGTNDNLCKFLPSDAFTEIFGSADELIGDDAVIISNMDCSCENIIFLENGEIKIFDYEWFYDFSIPVDFIKYRMMWVFYVNNKEFLSWKILKELLNISEEKVVIYEKMSDRFNRYVEEDSISNINYKILGKQFLEPKISESNIDKIYYQFPRDLIPVKLIIIKYIKKSNDYSLVAWADKKADLHRSQGMNVIRLEELYKLQYDFLLISVMKEDIANEIRKELVDAGIEENKVIWVKPQIV